MSADLRLYALVDPERAGGRDLAELAWLLARGGATLVQLRDKRGSTQAMVETARAIRGRLAPLGVPFLINDRADVAFAAGPDGGDLGGDDMAGRQSRRPARPIGAIAGIDASNADAVIGAGADGVAVISALSLAGDPQAAARDLRAIVEVALARRQAA